MSTRSCTPNTPGAGRVPADAESVSPRFFPSHLRPLQTLINDEFGIGGGRAKTLAEVYTRHKPRLVEALAAHAFASPVPRMTAVSWRADHVISSSEAGTPRGRHQFFVAFKTTAPAASGAEAGYDSTDALRGAGEEIRFACTLEQMQHLVGTLRDACRAAERFP